MLTKWEIGQELLAISDDIGEVRQEFTANGLLDLSEKLAVIQAQIGDLFNDNNDHVFGIFDSTNLKKLMKRTSNDKR